VEEIGVCIENPILAANHSLQVQIRGSARFISHFEIENTCTSVITLEANVVKESSVATFSIGRELVGSFHSKEEGESLQRKG
jgi:hypothetical protein